MPHLIPIVDLLPSWVGALRAWGTGQPWLVWASGGLALIALIYLGAVSSDGGLIGFLACSAMPIVLITWVIFSLDVVDAALLPYLLAGPLLFAGLILCVLGFAAIGEACKKSDLV